MRIVADLASVSAMGGEMVDGLDAGVIAELRAALARAPSARAAIAVVLDQLAAPGRRPRRVTVAIDPSGLAALRAVFSARAVRADDAGRAHLDLTRVPADVAAALAAALDRPAPAAPRDHAVELQQALAALPAPGSPLALAYLASVRADPRGPLAVAATRGLATALHRVDQIARVLDAIAALPGPVRAANLAARALGDSKALAPGSELARAVGEALLACAPAIQAEVAAHQPATAAAACAAALAAAGLVRDLASVLVHAFGPLRYAVGGVTFGHVADHAALGAPTPLSLAQLRGARLVELPVERITIFENQAPFLDYVERVDPRRELVIFASGQATWAVVALLRLCAASGAPIRHAGDLDRSGVLILRSLAARAHVRIAPWHMDAATHARFAAAGRPITPAERARLAALLVDDPPTAPGHDLLQAIHATGVWIEQEAIAHTLWIPPPPHAQAVAPAAGRATRTAP